jgi:hypothetical protein
VRIHSDESPVAKIDLDQSNTRGCHRSHSAIIRRQKLRSFLNRFRGSDLHRRKTWFNLCDRPSLSTPGELRRATSVTFAPGANVSSTIRALSSCDQRRRSEPIILLAPWR